MTFWPLDQKLCDLTMSVSSGKSGGLTVSPLPLWTQSGKFTQLVLSFPNCNCIQACSSQFTCTVHTCMLSRFSYVWLFATLWTIAHQALLSMGFYRQEYWSRLVCPPPGDLTNPGILTASLTSPALAGRFFTIGTTWETSKLHYIYIYIQLNYKYYI